MENKVVIIVDNSNIFIEGGKYSAKQKGVFRNNEETRDPQDPSWRVDFGQLLNKVANGRGVSHAVLVGSRPPSNDSVWEAAENNGFQVTVHERSSDNKEKAVDTELVAQGTEIICTVSDPQYIAILSGDRDFIPLVKMAQKHGWLVEMWAFKSAYNPNGELAMTVDIIQPLDEIFAEIGHSVFVWP